MRYGLSEERIKSIIQEELDKNPDLKYYINNPYFDEFITLLLNGISKAIALQSKSVIEDINRDIRQKTSSWR